MLRRIAEGDNWEGGNTAFTAGMEGNWVVVPEHCDTDSDCGAGYECTTLQERRKLSRINRLAERRLFGDSGSDLPPQKKCFMIE